MARNSSYIAPRLRGEQSAIRIPKLLYYEEFLASFQHFSDLILGYSYLVIGIEANDLRLLNDQGRPYLYDHQLFEIVDAHEPSDWITEFGEDGERYAYPPALNEPGFFEDFFDTEKKAVATFWQTINHCLARYATADAIAV